MHRGALIWTPLSHYDHTKVNNSRALLLENFTAVKSDSHVTDWKTKGANVIVCLFFLRKYNPISL